MHPFYSRLGIPADIGTLSGIHRLVAERAIETRHMDFKRQIFDIDDLADDLCALANIGGGVLILGVATDKADRAESLQDHPLRTLEQQSVQAARDGIDEPIIIEPFAVPINSGSDRGYLIVGVPSTDRRPHITVKRGRVLHRVGTHNKPMTRREMGAAFAAAGDRFAIEFGLTQTSMQTSVSCKLIKSFASFAGKGSIKVTNNGALPALNVTIESATSPLRWAKDEGFAEGDSVMTRLSEDHIPNPNYLPIRRLLPGLSVVLSYERDWGSPTQDVLRITWDTPDGQTHQSEQSWTW